MGPLNCHLHQIRIRLMVPAQNRADELVFVTGTRNAGNFYPPCCQQYPPERADRLHCVPFLVMAWHRAL